MDTFENMGLGEEILKAVKDLGFERPTSIQEKCIPHLLKSQKDLIALAQTGTGKTAAFSLPIIEQLQPEERYVQGLILCPTRELCIQISKDIETYIKYLRGISVVSVYGGERIDKQIRALSRGGHIVVGTPGRVRDLIGRRKLKLGSTRWVVLDEADEMLDMGFKDDLDAILDETPDDKQTLLFSATMKREVARIAKKYMHDPEEISVSGKNVGTDKVQHWYYMAHARDRYQTLRRILDVNPNVYGIVFCRTRKETAEVANKLMADHYSAEPLHGDLTQAQRDLVMNRFRKKQVHLLVATDVAARGIDVDDLTHIVNYNLPDSNETYVHRSGRTGRADKTGTSVSIINMREVRKIQAIEHKIGRPFEQKKIPIGKDICEKQLFNLIDKVEKVEVNQEQIGPFMEAIYKKLDWLDREELIKHFVSIEFNRFLEFYKNAPDLNTGAGGVQHERRDSGPRKTRDKADHFSRFSVNLGFKHKFNAKGLLSLINKQFALQNMEIGRIEIGQASSHFEVDRNYEQNLQKSLRTAHFQGIPVIVKPAMASQGGAPDFRKQRRRRPSRS